jgi:multicomponent Na+:H+ antiporter subunit G
MEMLFAIISLCGSIFLFLGALGILRMPDVYNRMQAGTKATTLGTILFSIGIGLANFGSAWCGKIGIIILFVIATNPVSSNVIARASHFYGIKLAKLSLKDELRRDEREAEGGGQ